MKAKKQQKAKNRQKVVARKKNPDTSKPTEAQLRYEINKRGLVATAEKYRKVLDTGNLESGPSNEVICQGFVTFIDIMAPIHATVEIAELLVKEGKITFTEDEWAQIRKFDEEVVKVCEDVTAITDFMEEGLSFQDFADLYVHYAELSAHMASDSATKLYKKVLRPHGQLITNYAQEHKLTGEVDMAFAMRIHEQRMKTIVPLYRTQVAVPELEVPAVGGEFIPAEDYDVSAELAKDVSEGDK